MGFMAKAMEYRKLSEIKKLEGNPRVIRDKEFKTLCNSIRDNSEYFEARPVILSNRTGELIIIAGNQRYEAAKSLKLKQVPTFLIEGLTELKEKEIIIRDNISNGDFNFDILANEWSDLPLVDWGVDLPEDWLNEGGGEGLTDPDAVPEVPKVATTKPGDVWLCGKHRVMCGDSTKAEDVGRLMDGVKADMVFTDPPYGMDLDTDYTKIMDRGKKYEKVIGDDVEWIFDKANWFDCEEQFWWGADWYRRTLPPAGGWFVWDKQISEHDGLSHTGSLFELCWSKQAHKREIIKVPYFRFYGMDTDKRLHPTQKPVKLCSWFIEKFSKEDNVIADLFGGSGSTLIAAEQTGRTAHLMEIDCLYCDVIVKRFEDYTGEKATLEA